MSRKMILVGDNPFHGVSHLSQERALKRDKRIMTADSAADIVIEAVENGANGFTFTVSETTLEIVKIVAGKQPGGTDLYPLVPNVAELVRTAGSSGGVPALARDMAFQVLSMVKPDIVLNLAKGIVINDPGSLFNSYLTFEYGRIQQAAGRKNHGSLKSVLLHEVVTDMALALNLEWIFQTHIQLMNKLGLKPGFETRNLPYMARQFKKWRIDPAGLVILAPFNAIGFQMCPSKEDCEIALKYLSNADVIAFSILAAGYIKINEALDYSSSLKDLSGVAMGVSSREQAAKSFSQAGRNYV